MFVEQKRYERYASAKKPAKKTAVLTCMDTRLTELLPAALNFKNGDGIIIKNAGALITHAFGSVMRSLLVAVYELGVEDILVIGHYDCGVKGLDASKMLQKMRERGIDADFLEPNSFPVGRGLAPAAGRLADASDERVINCCGVDLHQWLQGFESVEISVAETVKAIKSHPLIPSDIGVYGFIMDPETGRLDEV
ncbi:MAG: carbonic anhydrase [Firmicutes bacterium]|nr:carbonic anhydrase [Bacillota bacterium]